MRPQEEIANIRNQLQRDDLTPQERQALEEKLQRLLAVGPQETKEVAHGA